MVEAIHSVKEELIYDYSTYGCDSWDRNGSLYMELQTTETPSGYYVTYKCYDDGTIILAWHRTEEEMGRWNSNPNNPYGQSY